MDLNKLLAEAERQTNATKTDTELPQVGPSLAQLPKATQELNLPGKKTGENHVHAAFNLPKLETLSSSKSLGPLNPLADNDVEGYLKNERENAIVTVIEETNRNIFKTVEKNRTNRMFADWEEEKERLLKAMVAAEEDDLPIVPQMVPTVLPQDVEPQSSLNRMESFYAWEVTAYNEYNPVLLQQGNKHIILLNGLTQLAKEKLNNLDNNSYQMWHVLSYKTDRMPFIYNPDTIKDRGSPSQFAHEALTYLEKFHKEYMTDVIEKNRPFTLGDDVPNVYNTVKYFVGVIFPLPNSMIGLSDISNGLPLWPLIYFSLRSGDLGAAIRYLNGAGVCPNLLMAMQQKEEWNGHDRPHTKLELQLKLEYNNIVRFCTDPYKRAVYAILLSCDTYGVHRVVVRTIDDFLWMQLLVFRKLESSEIDFKLLNYDGLQALVLEKYGEMCFNAREMSLLYFEVLVLTGELEAAIEFLGRSDANRPHAVHMALALNELNLLATPRSIDQPLLSFDALNPSPKPMLNLARLVTMYAQRFQQTDIREALQYYYLLRMFKATDGRNLMLACICDMLVENSDDYMISVIFGKPDPNNLCNYKGGVLETLRNMVDDNYVIGSNLGDELARRSKYEAAIKLYIIADDLGKAVNLVSSLLSQVVHQRTGPGSMREKLVKITDRINLVLGTGKPHVDEHTMGTYQLLSRLLKFFDYYHNGETRLATEVLAKQHIIPETCRDVAFCVSSLKQARSDIVRVLPDVLLAYMNIIYMEYTQIKTLSEPSQQRGHGHDDSNDVQLMKLRERAKALTNMATALPFGMPLDTSHRLVQLEFLMH